jgi:hypothetical protein
VTKIIFASTIEWYIYLNIKYYPSCILLFTTGRKPGGIFLSSSSWRGQSFISSLSGFCMVDITWKYITIHKTWYYKTVINMRIHKEKLKIDNWWGGVRAYLAVKGSRVQSPSAPPLKSTSYETQLFSILFKLSGFCIVSLFLTHTKIGGKFLKYLQG